MIAFKHISVGYGSELFSTEDVQLLKGKMIVLIGPNGSGKTTLFNTLLGKTPLLSGSIQLGNKKIDRLSADEKVATFGFVPSRFPGVDHLSVRELIAMGRAPYTNILNRLSVRDQQIIDEVIDELGLNHLQDKSTIEISDGERQIAMIGKVLAQQTKVILLDEPTAFLDYSNRNKVLRILKDLSIKDDKLVIVSSHDLDLCLNYADMVLAIDKKERVLLNYEPPFDKERIIQLIFD